MEPEYTPARKIHLYHCDHRGLPLALINEDGSLAWSGEFDEWGSLLHEENPESLQQLIRLPGQQYDAETGLYYNRHRYYDPRQGRYITQDPSGLTGGWNGYLYPSDPLSGIDPLGLVEFGKWAGSAVNAASEGNMSYEDTAAAIEVANGPHYSPPLFSMSVDGGLSAYGIFGGSVSAGVTTGNGDKGLDLCTYFTACQGAGAGASAGASVSASVSNAPPGSGVSYYGGATTDVGFIANGTATVLSEINKKEDPTHISLGVAGGIGGGSFSGVVTCQQNTKCVVN
ncbi:RHS repeat-associated core domain-containing protein, partial [Lelliottia wanjuensis]|uniref:RHS repeat-associated core domain-containing protein n=1 Tax=Lelliottia wanjuensis TaxID=3050585 RepID=UPI0033071495